MAQFIGDFSVVKDLSVGASSTLGGLNIATNVLSSVSSNANIQLAPNGTGIVDVQADMQATGFVQGGNLRLATNTISSQDTNGNIILAANGTGILDMQSGVQIDGSQLDVDNLQLSGNSIISTDTDGDINLTPNGNGLVVLGSAVRVGNTSDATAGNFRWTGSDLQVYTGTSWTSVILATTNKYVESDADQAAADTAWGTASGGYYSRTILGATHGISNPSVKTYEKDGSGNRDEVFLDRIRVDLSTGDITIRVPDSVGTLPIMEIHVL